MGISIDWGPVSGITYHEDSLPGSILEPPSFANPPTETAAATSKARGASKHMTSVILM